MQPYQKFPISNQRTALDEAVEPWLLPGDAYQSMLNAHLYRGVLEKIDGYDLFAPFSYRNFLQLTFSSGTTYVGTLPTIPTTSNFFGYGTRVSGVSAETFAYNGDASATVINLLGSFGGTGTVNLTPGPNFLKVTLIFNVAPPVGTYDTVFFIWDSAPTTVTAIMGIKPYFGPNNLQELIIFDQKRMGKVVANNGFLSFPPAAVHGISEIPHAYYQSAVFTGNGATLIFTSGVNATALQGNIIPNTVTFQEYLPTGETVEKLLFDLTVYSKITDNGQGALLGPVGSGITGQINYTTGAYTITFLVAPPLGNYYDATSGHFGNIFTGTISNFFTIYNYQYKLFFTNNKDPISYYDGNLIQYLNTNLTIQIVNSIAGVPQYDITRALHLTVNRERLILLNVRIGGIDQGALAVWSRALEPTDFTNDELLYAPTSESIVAFSYINTDLIVRFTTSERKFTFTSDAFDPFRWDTINSVWACDAPYSAINYDKRFVTVGKPAIVTSDGVNVRRADDILPDFTDPDRIPDEFPAPFMSQTSVIQCYGQRFDDLKEGWMCYNSFPPAQSVPTASDHILAFSYLDNAYAIYEFPFSCLGLGKFFNIETWGTTHTKWKNDSDTWGDYDSQAEALLDLGGDQYDRVYRLNSANTRTVAGVDPVTNAPIPVLFDVITKNFNPFIEDGQLAVFGYIDLFVSADINTTLRVQFYVNDQLYVDGSGVPQGWYKEETLRFVPTDNMSPATGQIKVWKRIYVNSIGKEHTMRLYQNIADFELTNDQPIFIHGLVLYMKPGGLIFN